MAVNSDGIQYYNKNVLRDIAYWNIMVNTVVSGDSLNIGVGGRAGYDLVNTYNNGLKASLYRSISVFMEASITQQYNYQNNIEIMVKGVYRDREGNRLAYYNSIGVTLLLSDIEDGTVKINRVLSMENYDFESLTLYVINNTNSNITLISCVMNRSQDISSSQVGESIGMSITLSKVLAYLDGCEVYFDDVELPVKMWWMEDGDGVFNGVNVDNERLIKFSRVNEILLD